MLLAQTLKTIRLIPQTRRQIKTVDFYIMKRYETRECWNAIAIDGTPLIQLIIKPTPQDSNSQL